MCGVPYHAAEGYMAKLIKAGKRAAICDQVGEPAPGRIVQREVTQIISPGTISDLNLLEAKRNNYLAAIYLKDERYGFAYVDLSTGEFRLTEAGEFRRSSRMSSRASARRGACQRRADGATRRPWRRRSRSRCDGYTFCDGAGGVHAAGHFQVQSLDGFGCGDMPAAIGAAGAVLHYLKNGLRRQTGHITRLSMLPRTRSFMILDAATQAQPGTGADCARRAGHEPARPRWTAR